LPQNHNIQKNDKNVSDYHRRAFEEKPRQQKLQKAVQQRYAGIGFCGVFRSAGIFRKLGAIQFRRLFSQRPLGVVSRYFGNRLRRHGFQF